MTGIIGRYRLIANSTEAIVGFRFQKRFTSWRNVMMYS